MLDGMETGMECSTMQVLARDEQGGRDWGLWWAVRSSLVAWALANALDVFSVLVLVQAGGRMVLARHHPAESFLIYAGLRLLGTLAVPLAVVSAGKRWPSVVAGGLGSVDRCVRWRQPLPRGGGCIDSIVGRFE